MTAFTDPDLHALEAGVTVEEVERRRVRQPSWRVRVDDTGASKLFAEFIKNEPHALPMPDYVATGVGDEVIIGTGNERTSAVFEILKRPSIQARVWHPHGDPEELAFRLGLQEDAVGPRAMRSEDKLRNAIHLHEVDGNLSNRQIARAVSLSHTRIDSLAHEDWQLLPRPPKDAGPDHPSVARRAVRAMLELCDAGVNERRTGRLICAAIRDLTEEGEEVPVARFIAGTTARAQREIER